MMKVILCVFASWACGVMADTADDALALAQRTLAYVEKAGKRPEMATELHALAQRLQQAKEPFENHIRSDA